MDERPEGVDGRGRLPLHEHGQATTARGALERVDERADGLDVVADVGDEHDIAARRLGQWPAAEDRPDVADVVLGRDLVERGEHARRGVDGDDITHAPRDGQREASGPGTHVQPRLVGPGLGRQAVEHRVVVAQRIGPEEARDRGVEVGSVGHLAQAVDLLAVGDDASRPGALQQGGQVGHRVDVGQGAPDRDVQDPWPIGQQPAEALRRR